MSKASRFTDDNFALIESSMDRPARDVATEYGWSVRDVYDLRYKIRTGWVRIAGEPYTADEMLVISKPLLTIDQMTERLPGRSATSIRTQRHRMGIADKSKVGLAKTSPYMPGRRPLLAKTCPKCGVLYGASMFGKGGQGRISSYCKICNSSATSSRVDERKRSAVRAYQKMAQAVSERYAQKQGQEYTEADHAVLRDESKTVLEKALELSRTYIGVGSTMTRNGYKSRHISGDPTRDRWLIDNPNACRVDEITAALKQEFTDAGVKFPEWDWDDEDLKESA